MRLIGLACKPPRHAAPTGASAELIRLLKENGWTVVRIKGGHHPLRHPDGRLVTVPHPKKDLGKGLVNAIKRQTGLK